MPAGKQKNRANKAKNQKMVVARHKKESVVNVNQTNDENEQKNGLDLLSRMPTFLGVFTTSSLTRLKIMFFPISLIFLYNNCYVGLYATKSAVEIMDPMGCLENIKNIRLKNFLEAHTCGKTLIISPKFLPKGMAQISLRISALFVYLRVHLGKTLCAQLKLFSAEVNKNAPISRKIIQLIKNT